MKDKVTNQFDIIVVGGGHAGCEAALSSARMGLSVGMITLQKNSIGRMSCNPSIGGLAKSQLAREVDALGGEMAKNADATAIQFRLLNTKKGSAVQAYRVQSDKYLYEKRMQTIIFSQKNISVIECAIVEFIIKKNILVGAIDDCGRQYFCKALIITSGTFLNGYIHRGRDGYGGGRDGEKAATGLTQYLKKQGFSMGRLKTGTPPRISCKNICFSEMVEQPSDKPWRKFSFFPPRESLDHISCYLTASNCQTHKIVSDNLDQSPMYSGKIKGVGPRYCPSFEDKVFRFPQRERHQIFLEPEGLSVDEIYVNGLSTSLPQDIQLKMLRSIRGLEKAEVIRYGYAVEYDFLYPNQLRHTLETRKINGLYFAGQVNGTSGYEEAACQGLIAGVNAALKIKGEDPLVLGRDEAYIGVLIDDLITKNTEEPYRMFTSQAEYRLLLRNDNADMRLMKHAYRIGLLCDNKYQQWRYKKKMIHAEIDYLTNLMKKNENMNILLSGGKALLKDYPETPLKKGLSDEWIENILTEIKYFGYIEKQKKEIQRLKQMENIFIPEDFSFEALSGIKQEAKEKMFQIKPINIGQASRIMGVTPSDIAVLIVFVESWKKQKGKNKKCVQY